MTKKIEVQEEGNGEKKYMEEKKKGQIPTAIHIGSYHILFLFY
jgi:hypothetical protein